MIARRVWSGVPGECSPPRRHFVKDEPERELVRPKIHLAADRLLRTHLRNGALDEPVHRLRLTRPRDVGRSATAPQPMALAIPKSRIFT